MTKRIDYALMDPAGNITLLVKTPVPPESQPRVAALLMRAEPAAEQVGFLSSDPVCDLSLRMAGGEFCGNAARSAAFLHGMDLGAFEARFSVRVSGAADPVTVVVSPLAQQARVDMPPPLSIESVCFPGEPPLPLVRFGGISHVILERTPDRAAAEAAAPVWCRQLKADALGLMFLDRASDTLTPLVFVPAADTLFWENSCASGTAAVAAWLARDTACSFFSVALRQPGGYLKAEVSPEGDISLAGRVELLERKFLDLDF